MCSSPSLIPIERPPAIAPPQVHEALRILLGLIQTPSKETQKKTCGSNGSFPEEVLVDLDLDGYRYLLLRMPSMGHCRIRLSPREQEIVRMVAKGHPNKVIADVLSISTWTVCTHLRRIFAKLGVGSRAAMVAQLLEIGALSPDHRVTSAIR
jgi:DNA-binding CsgD family transcriptional regulator